MEMEILCNDGFSGEKEKEDEYVPEYISSGRGLQKMPSSENVRIAYFACLEPIMWFASVIFRLWSSVVLTQASTLVYSRCYRRLCRLWKLPMPVRYC
jgi:hypothetical protein